LNESAIGEERLVQRRKGVVVRQGVKTELPFDEFRIRHQRRRQVRHSHPNRQSMHGRERHRVLAIDKNEPGTGQLGEQVFFQGGFGGGIVCRFSGGLERQPGQRRHVGETPVFVLQRRETEFGKARNAALRSGSSHDGCSADSRRLKVSRNGPMSGVCGFVS